MSKKLKITRSSGNIFADIGFDKDEAENLKLRAELMMRIEDCCRKNGVPQAAMAKVLGLTAPRLNALLKGKIGLFSLDALVNIATRAGLSVRLIVEKAARETRQKDIAREDAGFVFALPASKRLHCPLTAVPQIPASERRRNQIGFFEVRGKATAQETGA